MIQLDESQLAFCDACSTNLRLLAPAGCGKTISLFYRCKALAERQKAQRPRFLLLTFTVAARDELRVRLHEQSTFAPIRDFIDITTLNSWGFKRVRNAAFSPKLIVSKKDFHFAMLNQLQPVWMRHARVKGAVEQKRNIVPRKIIPLMDSFKALGFDHLRHRNYEEFAVHLEEIRSHGLGWEHARTCR